MIDDVHRKDAKTQRRKEKREKLRVLHNQRAIAQRLGLCHTRFLEELALLSTGARLQRQGK